MLSSNQCLYYAFIYVIQEFQYATHAKDFNIHINEVNITIESIKECPALGELNAVPVSRLTGPGGRAIGFNQVPLLIERPPIFIKIITTNVRLYVCPPLPQTQPLSSDKPQGWTCIFIRGQRHCIYLTGTISQHQPQMASISELNARE